MVKNLSAIEGNVVTTVLLPKIYSVNAFLNIFNLGLHVINFLYLSKDYLHIIFHM